MTPLESFTIEELEKELGLKPMQPSLKKIINRIVGEEMGKDRQGILAIYDAAVESFYAGQQDQIKKDAEIAREIEKREDMPEEANIAGEIASAIEQQSHD